MIALFLHEIHIYRSLVLDRNFASMFALEVVFDETIGPFGDIDLPGFAGGLHAAGNVDSISPDIVNELVFADYPGNHRA